jgi:exodeoxyribonuclease VII small subunit
LWAKPNLCTCQPAGIGQNECRPKDIQWRSHRKPEDPPGGYGKELKSRNPRPCYRKVEADDKTAKLTFETALAKLETIVESMESGDVPLHELLAKFEEGNRLLRLCESRLKDAEIKIEQLKKQKDSVAFVPFDTEHGA